MNTPLRIDRNSACLLLVDIQERLLPAVARSQRIQDRATLAARAASILGLPVFATEQYRKGLGVTIPGLAAEIPSFAPVEKLDFSAWRVPALQAQIAASGRKQVLLAGIECHVCILQTGLDLIASGYQVFVLQDATGSRSDSDWQLGIDRMRSAGAVIVSTEMAIFELLGRAGTPEFKAILGLIK